MHNNGELLPCPFCGGQAVFVGEAKAFQPNFSGDGKVICVKCYTQTGGCFKSKENATKQWNTRTPSPATKKEFSGYMTETPKLTYCKHKILEPHCDDCFPEPAEVKDSEVERDEVASSSLWNQITNFYPAFQGEIGHQNKIGLYNWILDNYERKRLESNLKPLDYKQLEDEFYKVRLSDLNLNHANIWWEVRNRFHERLKIICAKFGSPKPVQVPSAEVSLDDLVSCLDTFDSHYLASHSGTLKVAQAIKNLITERLGR